MKTALMAHSLLSVRIKAGPPHSPPLPSPSPISLIPRTVMIRASTMAFPVKTYLLALILLLIPLSSGMAEGLRVGKSPIYLLHKDGARALMNSNLELDAVLDYDYAGANPKHDPRKAKPGNGGSGKNP